MKCSPCPEGPGRHCCASLCHLAGTPEWDRHILGRNRLPCPGEEPEPARVAPIDPEDLARNLAAAKLRRTLCAMYLETDCGCQLKKCHFLGRGVRPEDCADCLGL